MIVLKGTGVVLDIRGTKLGVAGVKGFGGGFGKGLLPPFGEPEMKAFAACGRSAADRLAAALSGLDCDVKLAVTHYAPVADTLVGEQPELYPVLGCEHLGRAIDRGGAAMAIHGHAHRGSERGPPDQLGRPRRPLNKCGESCRLF
jgi:Icc-related predicted phosphoesterase